MFDPKYLSPSLHLSQVNPNKATLQDVARNVAQQNLHFQTLDAKNFPTKTSRVGVQDSHRKKVDAVVLNTHLLSIQSKIALLPLLLLSIQSKIALLPLPISQKYSSASPVNAHHLPAVMIILVTLLN